MLILYWGYMYGLTTLGLIVGDEILCLNGKIVSELDMVFVETILYKMLTLTMTIRSCRTERPYNTLLMEVCCFKCSSDFNI